MALKLQSIFFITELSCFPKLFYCIVHRVHVVQLIIVEKNQTGLFLLLENWNMNIHEYD